MGAQWQGMGRSLYSNVPLFTDSVNKSAAVLSQYDIDLVKLLLEGDDEAFNDTLNSFVGIAAIQVCNRLLHICFII